MPFATVLAFASGLASTYILKPTHYPPAEETPASTEGENDTVAKGEVYASWGELQKIKFVLSVLLTPLVEPLVMLAL